MIERRGDEAELFDRHAHWLERTTASSVCADPELIADACMRTWVIFLEHQPERDRLRAWLRLVARREALGLLRSEARRGTPTSAAELERPGQLLEHLVETRTAARGALIALAELPARNCQALALQAAGYSYAELQELLGISYTCLDRLLKEGRAKLRAGEGGEKGRRRS